MFAKASTSWSYTGARHWHLSGVEPIVQLPGERDFLWYIALGVGAVIPPCNFPAANHGAHDRGLHCERNHGNFETLQ